MNTSGKYKVLISCLVIFLWVTSCKNEDVVDFGFDGSFSGTLKDQAGNTVPGDITSNSLAVKALGEGDKVTTDIRVKGDGTYQHTKLYPKIYKIWVSGPVSLVTDTLVIDFKKEKSVAKDMVVTPFVSIDQPVVVGSPTSTSVDISYAITGNDGKVVSKRELYCSTNPYPDTSTGSGPFFDTKKVTLTANTGSASVTDLAPHTKYFIRIGAQASGTSAFNFSEQVIIETP